MSELPIDDAKSLIQAIADLARMADRALPATATKLTQRLRDHLGEIDIVPNTSVALDPIERANVQLALDEVRETSSVWEEFWARPPCRQLRWRVFCESHCGHLVRPGRSRTSVHVSRRQRHRDSVMPSSRRHSLHLR
jgi:hypothetical protein